MKIPLQWNRDAAFVFGLGLAFLLGFWLRWYLLMDQVLLDDEWHGFYYAIGKSPGWLLTHFSIPGATCIPLNLYAWLLGATIGWSELALRLPSLVCGVFSVVVGMLLTRKLIGMRRAVLLGFLLAISPSLIFFSRIFRPYSAVALLTFTALLLAVHWMQSNEPRLALPFIGTGILAVYLHLFAIVTVATPALTAFVFLAWKRVPGVPQRTANSPSLRQWIWVLLIMTMVSAILLLPALIHSLQGTFFKVAFSGTLSLRSLPQATLLMSGMGQPVLAILFWSVLIIGAVEQCRRNPLLGWMLVSLYPLHILALILSRPQCAQSAIVLVRYCIPLVPVNLLFVACGILSVLEAIPTRKTLRPILQTTIATTCVMALAITGPLPQCYLAPNNFTSHGAFQHDYTKIDWRYSFQSSLAPPDFTLNTVVRAEEVSLFYQLLACQPSDRPVVEYPMMIGDQFNPFYYYQHFHHRPVLIGYVTNVSLSFGLATGNIYGSTYIDQVLSLVPDPAKLRFLNFVGMDDLTAMRQRGVEYVILHKRFEAQLSDVAEPLPSLEQLNNLYHQKLGMPFYEDANVTVFRL